MADALALKLDRPPTLTEAAAARLTDAILTGQFKAGQRLVETDLSAMLGISRAPLREALRALAGKGLIHLRPSRGAVVVSPTPDDIEHLVLFRALIEGAAARLIAYRRDPAVLQKLARVVVAMEDAAKQGEIAPFLKHAWDFHGTLCAESNNPLLLQSWGMAGDLTKLYLQRAVQSIDFDAALHNHRAILAALRKSEPAEAESMVRTLIIRLAYELMDRGIPQSIGDYVNRRFKPAAVTPRKGKAMRSGRHS